jgi:hypothetical protein
MQVIALILFWQLVGCLASIVVLFSFAMQIDTGKALRGGIIRSVAGALVLQAISAPLFIVLIIATWAIQDAARLFGAGADDAIWVGLPVGLLALAVPPTATLCGAYIGFRAGWLRATGHNPQAALSGDLVARLLHHLGPANPVRW